MTQKREQERNGPETDHEAIEAEPVTSEELDQVRDEEAGPSAPKAGNIFIGTVNVFASPLRSLVDPVKKVCYLPLQEHWEEKYKKRYPKTAGWMLILDIFLLLVVGALVVGGMFAYFVMPIFPQPPNVSLQVLTPKTVISGAPVDFAIAYRNETGAQLAGAELKVRLPEGFIGEEENGAETEGAAPARPTVTDALTRSYPVGIVPTNGRGEIRISGTVYGPVGSKKTLTAELYYWKEGATTPVRVVAYQDWLVHDAVLGLTFRMEDEVIRGRQNAVTISYSNQSDEPIDSAIIRLSIPDDFSVTGASPRMSGRNEWRVADLDAGAKGAVTVYGILRSGGGRSAVPNFTVRGYLVRDGVRQLVQEIRQNVGALTTGFEISQEIGKPGGKMALSPGEEMDVTIRYRNGGKKNLTDLKISLEPTARYLLLPAEDYTWSAADTPELARLEPGQSGTIAVRLKIKDDIDVTTVGDDPYPMMEILTRAQYFIEDEPNQPVYADTAVLSLPISTKLAAKASALYFTKDGEQMGVGPLPPKAGQTTKYWVFVQITNTTNEVRNAKLEAYLPPDVSWTGRYSVTSGQPMAYLPVTSQIVWEIGQVPEFADGAGTKIGASFEVAITPGLDSVGTVPLLVKNIRVSGDDALTGARLFFTADDVTTQLPFGTAEAKAGKVSEQ